MGRKDVFNRGMHDAYQDRCENVPFSSTGGLDCRNNMIVPDYITPDESDAYLAGYRHCCQEMFGDDWKTCSFSWRYALTIGDE